MGRMLTTKAQETVSLEFCKKKFRRRVVVRRRQRRPKTNGPAVFSVEKTTCSRYGGEAWFAKVCRRRRRQLGHLRKKRRATRYGEGLGLILGQGFGIEDFTPKVLGVGGFGEGGGGGGPDDVEWAGERVTGDGGVRLVVEVRELQGYGWGVFARLEEDDNFYEGCWNSWKAMSNSQIRVRGKNVKSLNDGIRVVVINLGLVEQLRTKKWDNFHVRKRRSEWDGGCWKWRSEFLKTKVRVKEVISPVCDNTADVISPNLSLILILGPNYNLLHNWPAYTLPLISLGILKIVGVLARLTFSPP
ncbi:unnamed protein product [Amaranthus hypochondriacus]